MTKQAINNMHKFFEENKSQSSEKTTALVCVANTAVLVRNVEAQCRQ